MTGWRREGLNLNLLGAIHLEWERCSNHRTNRLTTGILGWTNSRIKSPHTIWDNPMRSCISRPTISSHRSHCWHMEHTPLIIYKNQIWSNPQWHHLLNCRGRSSPDLSHPKQRKEWRRQWWRRWWRKSQFMRRYLSLGYLSRHNHIGHTDHNLPRHQNWIRLELW